MSTAVRSPGARRSARWRERERREHGIYQLELHKRLVACLLQAKGYDVGPPAAEQYQRRCERALVGWLHAEAISATRYCDDAEVRVQVAEIAAQFKAPLNE